MAHGVREADRALSNEEIHSMLVSVEERWDSNDHLEDKDAEGPPIDGEVVAIADKHLRCQVLSRSAERVGELALLDELCKTEIGNQKISCKKKSNKLSR